MLAQFAAAPGAGAREGRWHALLRVSDGNYKEYVTMLRRSDQHQFQRAIAHGVPYIVNVQAHSNLRMSVNVHQSGLAPGADVTLRAQLIEYEQPLLGSGKLSVDITRPHGKTLTLPLAQLEQGVYEAGFPAAQSDIYRLLFRCTGESMLGQPFTREE
jgi:hypothetical protein